MPKTRWSRMLIVVLALLCLLPCAVAQADDSWMPENYTVLKPAPKERIITGMPKGMVADCTVTDGMIEYVIDADATNWESVLAYSYQASSGQAYIRPGIQMPLNATQQRCIGYSVDPMNGESKIVQRLQQDFIQYNGHRSNAINGYWIGRYDESTATYIPIERDRRPQGVAALWYDDAGNLLGGEYVLFTFVYTNTDARAVHITRVPESDITLNVPAFISNHGTPILASKNDGIVRYEVRNPQQLQSFIATTAIAAPQIDGKDVSRWTCHMRTAFGTDFTPCTMADAGQYGLTRRSALINSELKSTMTTEQTSWMLEWRDEQGQTQYVAMLPSVVICGEPAPWPVYAGWKPVPSSRLNLTYVNPIKSGTKLTYNETSGIAYFHINPSELPETAAYGDAHYLIKFTPPEGATAYEFDNFNSDNAFGPKDYMVQNAQNQLAMNGRYSCSENLIMEQGVFEPHLQESRDLTIYITALMPGEFSAEYVIINWYRDINDEVPMSTEYVFRQMDSCIRVDISKPFDSEENLPGKLTSTAIVIPNNTSAKKMQFVAELYPQESENSRYYELRLLDHKGERANLPAKSKIILPYPQGTSFEDVTISFNLRHLNAKYQTYEYFSEADGTLHREKDYLWFVPSSLSPFVLEWTVSEEDLSSEGAASAEELPSTGDDSHLLSAIAAMAMASAALYMQMKRRKA